MKINHLPLLALLFWTGAGAAQVPFEAFAGNERATLDVMFFKNIKKPGGEPSRLLFFNRNRASMDYRETKTTHLPQFGSTNALSFNHKKLGGLAPVAVLQVFSRGTFPKAGVQFYGRRGGLTFFSWVVAEVSRRPTVADWFVLSRFEPGLGGGWKIFSQVELVSSAPLRGEGPYSLIQRLRLGLKKGPAQLGVGADFTQNGRSSFLKTRNAGGFLRYEF